MTPHTSDEAGSDEAPQSALRSALENVEPLPTKLAHATARRARSAVLRPGEGTLSVRGVAYFSESTGVAALVLLAGGFYAVVKAMQIATLFMG